MVNQLVHTGGESQGQIGRQNPEQMTDLGRCAMPDQKVRSLHCWHPSAGIHGQLANLLWENTHFVNVGVEELCDESWVAERDDYTVATRVERKGSVAFRSLI